MEVDQPQPHTSSSVTNKESSCSNHTIATETEFLKQLNDLVIPKGSYPQGELPPRISFLHLQPSSLSHGYEVTPLQTIGPIGEYKKGVLLRKMKAIKCRLRTATCPQMEIDSRPCFRNRPFLRRKGLIDCQPYKLTDTDPVRMCHAACVNNIDSVKEMLEGGMSPNCYDCFQRTPLHIASCMGYKEMVALLLLHGANPNAKDRIGNTPLHLAACTNHIEVINLLLKAGTNVMEKDMAGHSPLHFAVTKFNIMSRSQTPGHKQQFRQVIAMLAEYMRVRDVSKVDNELMVKFENLLRKSKSNEPVDSGVRDLLNNLSSLSISSNN